MIGKGPSNLQARVLVGVMYDDVVAVPSDIHGREEVGAVQQECMAQAGNGASCHFERGHCCPVVPPLHWDLCRQAQQFRPESWSDKQSRVDRQRYIRQSI